MLFDLLSKLWRVLDSLDKMAKKPSWDDNNPRSNFVFDQLASLFRTTTPQTAEPRGELAVAALLVEAARQDGDYASEERAAIIRLLALEFALSPSSAETLCVEAEIAQKTAVDLFRFTHAVKQSTPFEERTRIIEHLWEVALSDGARDAAEDGLIRKLCGLLGVSDQESGHARNRVLARLNKS